MITDVFMTTYNRPEYMIRTVDGLFERTTTPFNLHVVDDGSTEGNQDVLMDHWRQGHLASLVLRRENEGFARGIDLMEEMTHSDPVVRLDDDVLCPLVEPDWLSRLLDAMNRYPDFGSIALNAASSNTNNRRHVTAEERARGGEVTECLWAAHYSALRRCTFEGHPLQKAQGWPRIHHDASKVWADRTRLMGLKVGYLTRTYCYHFGQRSSRFDIDISESLVEPVDPLTLEPPEEYRW
jgi:glycosyltransferase involved in cell wall biosynthesis